MANLFFSACLLLSVFYACQMKSNEVKTGRGLLTWYRMMMVIIFEQNFPFYLSLMLEADPS